MYIEQQFNSGQWWPNATYPTFNELPRFARKNWEGYAKDYQDAVGISLRFGSANFENGGEPMNGDCRIFEAKE